MKIDINNIDPHITEKIFNSEFERIIKSVKPQEEIKQGDEKEDGFLSSLKSAFETVRKAENEAKEKSVKMILGKTEDIHDVMIAREKADTLFQLFLEIRNRAIQAFENIMRMQF